MAVTKAKTFGLLLLQAALASADDDLVKKRLAEVFPVEVVTELDDRRLCIHFSGEEPYDEERRKDIERNLKEHCHQFEKIMGGYERKYPGKSWLKEFSKVWDAMESSLEGDDFIWKIPEGKSKVLSDDCEKQADLHIARLEVYSKELKKLSKGSEKYQEKLSALRDSWSEVGKLLGRQKFLSKKKYAELEKLLRMKRFPAYLPTSEQVNVYVDLFMSAAAALFF
jgi:hypothetical protein